MHQNVFPVSGWSLAFLFLLNFGIAFGSFYATRPVRSTIYESGRPASIKWIDDSREPYLEDMGNMWIKLFDEDEEWVATLAKNVSPTARTHTVFIPAGLKSSSHYCLTFSFDYPRPRTYWSADFSIAPTPYSYFFPEGIKLKNGTTISNKTSRLVPSSTATSDKPHSVKLPGSPTMSTLSGSLPSLAAPTSLTDQADSSVNHGHGSSNSNLRKNAGIANSDRWTYYHFLVYLYSPALMGTIMFM